MSQHDDLDPAGAHRVIRGVTIALVVGALILVIPAVLTTLGGPIATTLCTLVGAAALWVVTRLLRQPH